MTTFIVNEIEDEMVRDFTKVAPRSKSEVRRRINEYATKAYLMGEKKTLETVEKLLVDEINTAHFEGTPTARLTSLFNKIKKTYE